MSNSITWISLLKSAPDILDRPQRSATAFARGHTCWIKLVASTNSPHMHACHSKQHLGQSIFSKARVVVQIAEGARAESPAMTV